MGTFSGTSNRGNIAEALNLAIAKAKYDLRSTLVHWKLVSLEGVNGGFVQQNDVSAIIDAESGSGRPLASVMQTILNPQFSLENHEALTQTAGSYYVAHGTISQSVLDDIIDDNTDIDFYYPLLSVYHFDNCHFQGGVDYLAEVWNEIRTINDRFDSDSLEYFGELLHTVQDFYAHSNWVEYWIAKDPNLATIPTWNFQMSSLPSPIISGYVWYNSPKKCPSNVPSHGDLNKDDKNSPQGMKVVTGGPHAGKSYFQLAYDVALRSTKEQFVRYFGFSAVETSGVNVQSVAKRDYKALSEVMLNRIERKLMQLPVPQVTFETTHDPECACN